MFVPAYILNTTKMLLVIVVQNVVLTLVKMQRCGRLYGIVLNEFKRTISKSDQLEE